MVLLFDESFVDVVFEESVDDVVILDDVGFWVLLLNFDGLFDLLLNLILKYEMDIIEVLLSVVINEFIVYFGEFDDDEDFD